MRVSNLIVEVRNATLARVGILLPKDIELEANIAHNGVGTWVIRLAGSHPLADTLASPGAGIIVSDSSTGFVLFSGPTTAPKEEESVETAGKEMVEVSGVTDECHLADRLVWTDPTVDLRDSENAAANVVYTVTAKAENLLHDIVSKNLGSSALDYRQVAGLVQTPSGGIGNEITRECRYTPVLEVLQEVAQAEGLGFRIRHEDDALVFSTRGIADRTGILRLSVNNKRLKSSSVQIEVPEVTEVVVSATDDRAGYLSVYNTVSDEAAQTWNRRIEKFVSANSPGASATEMEETAQETLNASGFTNITAQAVAVDHEQTVYGVNWELGDLVTVEIDGQELDSQITGFVLRLQRGDGLQFGITLGDASGFDMTEQIVRSVNSVARRLGALERTAPLALNEVPAPVAAVSVASQKITNLATPTASTDAATKAYVDTRGGTAFIERTLTSTQSLTDNVEATVTWTNSVTAGSGGLSYSSGTFTAATAGLYLVQGTLTFATDADGRRYWSINHNGSSKFEGNLNPATGTATSMPFMGVLNLAAGDTFTVSARQNAGNALNIQTTSRITVTRLGGL